MDGYLNTSDLTPNQIVLGFIERQIFSHIVCGKSDTGIAAQFALEPNEVCRHHLELIRKIWRRAERSYDELSMRTLRIGP